MRRAARALAARTLVRARRQRHAAVVGGAGGGALALAPVAGPRLVHDCGRGGCGGREREQEDERRALPGPGARCGKRHGCGCWRAGLAATGDRLATNLSSLCGLQHGVQQCCCVPLCP